MGYPLAFFRACLSPGKTGQAICIFYRAVANLFKNPNLTGSLKTMSRKARREANEQAY